MTHFLRYKNKGIIEMSLTSLTSLTPIFLFLHFCLREHKYIYIPKAQSVITRSSFFASLTCPFFY